MTPNQLQAALDHLGSSQRNAGRWLGVGERQVRRWIAGDSAIPEPVAILLRLMVAHNISLESASTFRTNSTTLRTWSLR